MKGQTGMRILVLAFEGCQWRNPNVNDLKKAKRDLTARFFEILHAFCCVKYSNLHLLKT